MGGKRSKKLRDRGLNQGAGVSRHEPAGSHADEEARRFSNFGVRNASNVNVGTVKGQHHYSGALVINMNIGGYVADPENLLFNLSTRLAGEFPGLLAENAAPDPIDILMSHASRLWPDMDYQNRSPTDRPVRGRSRNDMASSNTRHETSIDGLPEHQENPPNQQHTPHNQDYPKTLAEKTLRHQPQIQHTAGGLAINGPDQREARNGWTQRLRSWWQRLRRKKR
ncbi:hypothetical protein GGR55DRAFT_657720 [Xylaria sp. FL0064]|nr:hypothetical protein GGR55DRAFT_657720 [Xylaria sp. FL0064]